MNGKGGRGSSCQLVGTDPALLHSAGHTGTVVVGTEGGGMQGQVMQ
jgi:hypothetical protein